MTINSDVSVCNMALSQLGNFGTISDIAVPTNDKERIFALWYDISRQFVLKLLMPNFALKRAVVAQLAEVPAFGYSYFYEYPNEALKIQGIGNAQDKVNNYAVEGNKILHNDDYPDGMPIRYIVDVTDINSWSPEAKLLLSQYLAAYTCLAVTQDATKAKKLEDALPAKMSTASGLNAQENMPVRVSNSRFKAARYSGSTTKMTDKN